MDLQKLLVYINRNQMLPDYAGINPKGGFNHRIQNKTTMGEPGAGLTQDEKAKMKAGLKKFVEDINIVIETL